jgi:hypothetical protein
MVPRMVRPGLPPRKPGALPDACLTARGANERKGPTSGPSRTDGWSANNPTRRPSARDQRRPRCARPTSRTPSTTLPCSPSVIADPDGRHCPLRKSSAPTAPPYTSHPAYSGCMCMGFQRGLAWAAREVAQGWHVSWDAKLVRLGAVERMRRGPPASWAARSRGWAVAGPFGGGQARTRVAWRSHRGRGKRHGCSDL